MEQDGQCMSLLLAVVVPLVRPRLLQARLQDSFLLQPASDPHAGALGLLRRMLLFRRYSDETCRLRGFAASLALLLAVVTAENFATWAVSASDQRKYDYTPLQVRAGLLE